MKRLNLLALIALFSLGGCGTMRHWFHSKEDCKKQCKIKKEQCKAKKKNKDKKEDHKKHH